ncbi:MAG TPA: class I tRNA ligase family protein [Candidatus Paceibacterota bacterium]|nr:class I tRNA ligase family protein [Candidatus Paceibacterota bacterium]
MESYNHEDIEKKWQAQWQADGIYTVKDNVPGKENFYELVEFTYPSGNLHTGHWYAFAVPDIHARAKRMQGYNVLYPMGFDAFGLPAENAAIKLGADPKTWTYEQMEKMRVQLRSMGAMFDWSREVVTCDPEYYRWTQWMFNQFFAHDLVYRAITMVNWCPKDQTILANEQVVDGCCERCGTPVIQREQPQWMLRITKYADRLIDDLDNLDWPHAIKEAQKHWIGRSVGAEISFRIADHLQGISVFTTRADTIQGVTFVALAPEHPLVGELLPEITNVSAVSHYIETTKTKSELDRQQSKEKTGVRLEGVVAVNPMNNEEVPIWIADYVLAGYGTGAVMGVPMHDERDRAFAQAMGIAIIDQPLLDRDHVVKQVRGKIVKTYRLRDWGISRQRYWGTPIPIVYDLDGNAHPVPDEHLPWLLPTDVDHTPDGTAPLARSKELFERTEKIFGAGWKPEVETMDTFVDSSWYFYRYLDNHNGSAFAAKEKMDAWMPIDLYLGGAEHTTMHLLYSRFWNKALFDLGLVKESEPYKQRVNRGLILGPDGNKMSKSKGNVVNPDEIVGRLGADTVRMYLAFMGPYGTTANYPWDPNGVVGVRRFLERVWKLKQKIGKGAITAQLHKTIKKVTEDIAEYKFNTAVASMMTLVNEWERAPAILEGEYKTLLQLLAPFAPHITEALWQLCGETTSVHCSPWPLYNAALLVNEDRTIGVQINGKLRGEVTVAVSAPTEEIQKAALALPRIKEFLDGKTVKNVIVVPGRIVNIVCE